MSTLAYTVTQPKKKTLLIRYSSVTDCYTDPIDGFKIGSVTVDLSNDVLRIVVTVLAQIDI